MRMYEPYTTSDGKRWFADADVGDEADYDLDIVNVLIHADASIDSVAWTLPSGITGSGEDLTGTISKMKLATPTAGSYKILITVVSTYGGRTITEVSPMYLKVI